MKLSSALSGAIFEMTPGSLKYISSGTCATMIRDNIEPQARASDSDRFFFFGCLFHFIHIKTPDLMSDDPDKLGVVAVFDDYAQFHQIIFEIFNFLLIVIPFCLSSFIKNRICRLD